MAKAKNQALTAEGRLAQALVPQAEQPYKVPENWVWTRLSNMIVTSKEKFDDFQDGDERKYIGLENIRKDTGIIGYDSSKGVKSVKNVFYNGEILYGKLRPYLNKHGIADFDGICSTDILVFVPTQITDAKYINYFFDTDGFIEYSVANSKGINLPRVSEGVILEVKCPLPPLTEQQRMVERIESLFEKLNHAKELAQNALDTFEVRKAAILHKAFTGELTAKWREEHYLGIESWKDCQIQDVCIVNPKRTDISNLSDDLPVTFVPMSTVSEVLGTIFDSQTKPLKEVKKGYTNFSEGDVIFAKITPCMENGKSAIVGKLENDIGFGSTEFHVLRCSNSLSNRYLYYLVRSQNFRDEAKAVMTGAVGQQRVPKSFLEDYSLHLPSLPEQQEIVRILDSLFEKEQRAKELCDVIEKIELIKKAILARAFRGELGTNDPSEESAVKLLKEVLE